MDGGTGLWHAQRPRSSVKPVAWVPRGDVDRGEWEAQGRWLGSIGRCSRAAEVGLRTCDVADAHLRTLLSGSIALPVP